MVDAPVIAAMVRRTDGEGEPVLLTALCDFRPSGRQLALEVREARLGDRSFSWSAAEYGDAVRAVHRSADEEYGRVLARVRRVVRWTDEDAAARADYVLLMLRNGQFEEAAACAEGLRDRRWAGGLGLFGLSLSLGPFGGASQTVHRAQQDVAQALHRLAGRVENGRPFTALADRLSARNQFG
ncbi:hypothetical protein ACFW1A_04950 [Kitasatospora sp. NPDC058965]|uniref:hypothetical protein n=1 Tax=Kitasatospora sp. NPDC058965 TaxID=3346682 RepID=UPI0036AF8836